MRKRLFNSGRLERLTNPPIKIAPSFLLWLAPYIMTLTPSPFKVALCSSKPLKYNNYDNAPFSFLLLLSSPQENLFSRLFTLSQLKLTPHDLIDTQKNNF